MRSHYTKGYSAFEDLIKNLITRLLEKHNYKDARDLANRNLTKGYNSHTQMSTYILEKQVKYLENKYVTSDN